MLAAMALVLIFSPFPLHHTSQANVFTTMGIGGGG